MTEQDHERMRDYLDGEISPANLDELNRLLENDTEARARFRSLATMEEGLRDLAEVGVDLEGVGRTLEDQGVSSFHESFSHLLGLLDAKARTLQAH